MLHRFVQGRAVGTSIVGCAALVSCADVIVGVPDVAAVQVDLDPPVVRVGEVATVRAVAFDRDGDEITHGRRLAMLLCRDTLVARVEGRGTGTLRGVAPGTTVVVAESGWRRDSVIVLVTR